MLIFPGKTIVFSSDIGRYVYCPRQIYMELKHGKITTKKMEEGTSKHKEIEDKEKEKTQELKEVNTLLQALQMSKFTNKVIESVDEYKMQSFFDGVLLVGKPDLIGAHKDNVLIIERKPQREGEELRKGEHLQVASYALLAQKETNLSYDRIQCYVDLYDRETAQITKRIRVPILPEHTFEVRQILKKLSKLASGEMPPKTDLPIKCKYCSYNQHCDSEENSML